LEHPCAEAVAVGQAVVGKVVGGIIAVDQAGQDRLREQHKRRARRGRLRRHALHGDEVLRRVCGQPRHNQRYLGVL